MLREVLKVKQDSAERRRRWFTDDRMDLFVWENEARAIDAFQLTYGKPSSEQAISWRAEGGIVHSRVDEGARPGQHPASPLLVADGVFDPARVIAEFTDRAKTIDDDVAAFVTSALRGLLTSQ